MYASWWETVWWMKVKFLGSIPKMWWQPMKIVNSLTAVKFCLCNLGIQAFLEWVWHKYFEHCYVTLVVKVCTSPRNSTWLIRPPHGEVRSGHKSSEVPYEACPVFLPLVILKLKFPAVLYNRVIGIPSFPGMIWKTEDSMLYKLQA